MRMKEGGGHLAIRPDVCAYALCVVVCVSDDVR
jgi:hypothetical protein